MAASLGDPTISSTINYSPNVETNYSQNQSYYLKQGQGGTTSEDWYQFPTQTGQILFDVSGYPQQIMSVVPNPLFPATLTDLEWQNISLMPYTWYNYASLTGNVAFIDASGNHDLQSIEGNLYYDGELLARAGDIQDIAAWADYPAINNVDMNTNRIDNAGDIECADIQCADVISGGDITAAAEMFCAHMNIFEAGTQFGDVPATTTEIFEGVITNGSDIVNQGDISTNTLHVTTTADVGSLSSAGDISGATLHISGTATIHDIDLSGCALTSDATGSALFVNGVQVQTGSPSDASQWATFPAVAEVQVQGNNLIMTGNLVPPATNIHRLGTALAPIGINDQYAFSTNIYNIAPAGTMNISSNSSMSLLTTSTTGVNEMNISLVGAAGEDMNLTAPDINLTMTDPASFMNLTAPFGVAVLGGGGFFMASGAMEVVTGLDIRLITPGNIAIGSGNVGGATTQIEKFEYTDNVVEPMNGVFDLKLKNIEVINVPRDAGSAGYFGGQFNVAAAISSTFTLTSVNTSSEKMLWQVQTDQGSSVFKSMNLISQGTGGVGFSMSAATGPKMTMNYAGATLTIDKPVSVTGNVGATTMTTGSLTATGDVAGGSGTFGPLRTSDTIIKLGFNAGTDASGGSVSIGNAPGLDQGTNSIAIGTGAGSLQGDNCIAIGRLANAVPTAPYNNTIFLNATGVIARAVADNSTYIQPLRNVSTQPAGTAFALGWTSATGEVTVANTKVNDIENTVNNTQQISYDTGLLTTTINGITSLQTVKADGPVTIGTPAALSTLTVAGTIAIQDASGNTATQVVAQPQYVYYVAKNGRVGATGAITDPLSTINAALAKTANVSAVDAPGMTIYVGVGSYTEDVAINIAPATLPSVSIIGMGDDTDDSKRVQIRGAMTINATDASLVNTVNTVVLNNLSVFAKDVSSSAITMTGRGYRVYLKNGLYTTAFSPAVPLISLASTGPTSNSVVQLVIDNTSMSMTGGAGHIISMTSGQLFEIQNTDMTHRGTGLAVNMSGGAFSVANQSAFTTTGAVFNIVQSAAGLTNVTSCLVSGRASPTVALITLGTNANINLSESTVQNLNTTEANNTSRYVYTTSATGNFIAAIRNNITNSASPATVQQITPWQAAVPAASQLLYFGNIYTNASATLVGVLPAQGGLNWNAVRQFNTDTYTQQLQVVATSGTAIVLTPTARGKTFILTGTTTQAFSTAGFGLADAGFFVIVHNGNASGGGDINMTGMTGTAIIHNRTGAQNGGDVYLYWTGAGLVGY
jgi:hypothetical protein